MNSDCHIQQAALHNAKSGSQLASANCNTVQTDMKPDTMLKNTALNSLHDQTTASQLLKEFPNRNWSHGGSKSFLQKVINSVMLCWKWTNWITPSLLQPFISGVVVSQHAFS